MGPLPFRQMKIVRNILHEQYTHSCILHLTLEMAAWLAANGPISIGINAAAMQVHYRETKLMKLYK